MEKLVYTEETITSMPSSAPLHEHIQALRDDLNRLENERDGMLLLLHELVDTEGSEEMGDVLLRVRDFVEGRAYPTSY